MFNIEGVCAECGEEMLTDPETDLCEPCWIADAKESANYSDNRYPEPESFKPAPDAHLEAQYEDRYIDEY